MPELVLYGIRMLAMQILETVLDIEVDQSGYQWLLDTLRRNWSFHLSAKSVSVIHYYQQLSEILPTVIFQLVRAGVGSPSTIILTSHITSHYITSHLITSHYITSGISPVQSCCIFIFLFSLLVYFVHYLLTRRIKVSCILYKCHIMYVNLDR